MNFTLNSFTSYGPNSAYSEFSFCSLDGFISDHPHRSARSCQAPKPNGAKLEIFGTQASNGHTGKNLALKSNLDLNLGSLNPSFFMLSTSQNLVKIKIGYIIKMRNSAIIILGTQIVSPPVKFCYGTVYRHRFINYR